MEMEGLKCSGCGSGFVYFDPATRILTCNTCGKQEFFSRATLNKNGKLVFCKENALKFFFEGKIDNAVKFAQDILNISKDYTPALFIFSYYDECVLRYTGSMKKFFSQAQDIPLEFDEVRDLIKLFKAAALNLSEFETDMLLLLAKNMQSPEDVKELSEFVDTICPVLISRQPSSNFFTAERAGIYAEFAEHCFIPRTCLALIKMINENPDSPYFGQQTFYLKARAQYFYNNVVIPVGNIITGMANSEYKQKFIGSYSKKKAQYEQDAGIIPQ